VAYLGNNPGEVFVETLKDTFSGDDSSTVFTLSVDAVTNEIEVFVENVQQEPTISYTASGTTLTFDSAPPAGTGNIYVIHRDPAVARTTVDTAYINDGAVTTAKLADNSVTNAKLANDSVEFAEIIITAENGIIRSTGTGQMYIAADSDIFLTSQDFLYTYADFRYGNGVRLYNDNELRFTTNSTGIAVTGGITADSMTATGSITADSFYGDGSALTGIDALPSQTGEGGKYLTTDGATASWDSVQSGAILDVFWTNAQSLTASYTIPADRSAITAGPITLDSGVEVTLDSNAVWVIL
jgi:hypothetical protein